MKTNCSTHTAWAAALLALGLSGAADARVSLTSIAADVDELRTTVCGAEGDCTTQYETSVDSRLDELDNLASAMSEALCNLIRDAGDEPPPELQCSTDGELRLVGSELPSEGRLEITFDDTWGTVCDDAFGPEEALVACRQLGFETGVALFRSEFGAGSGPIHLDDVACSGREGRLEDCSHRGIGVHNCSHFEDVGVRCTGSVEQTGDLRLVDGVEPDSGRLEVRLENDEWGTVCDDAFDTADATVACRQLGYTSGTGINVRSAGLPIGTGSIALDDLMCVGTEDRLVDCPHRGLEISNCSHFEDIAVFCTN